NGGWLTDAVQGRFVLLSLGGFAVETPLDTLHIADPEPLLRARYGTDCAYLIRPDGHIAAAFDTPDPAAIQAAYRKAGGTA
ncbi:MAG: FAD-dependent oxidoreductase, partial [Pseudomonadota bacterium]